MPTHILIFGATGAIGQSIAEAAAQRGWQITSVSRREGLAIDPFADTFTAESLRTATPYNAVVWAQGANCNDNIHTVDLHQHMEIYQANVAYILVTLKALLSANLLAPASRLCIISSIWQKLARQNKLSYTVSKAALQGLVLSAAVDLAPDGHLINAILPGALDTPMTRANLTPTQLDAITAGTPHHRLPALEDVASLACYLCSPQNTGITAQFIAADLGFSHARIL